MAIQPRSQGGESSPGEPGRYCRSLARCGVNVGESLVAAETALDERLAAAMRAYAAFRQQVDADLPHLHDLLLCDEDSPPRSQVADMLSATRQIDHLLLGQARAATDLMVLLREAAAAARALAERADAQPLGRAGRPTRRP